MNWKKFCKNKANIGTSHLVIFPASARWICISSARFDKANRLAHLLSWCLQRAAHQRLARSAARPQSWSHCLWLLRIVGSLCYRPLCRLIPPDCQWCQLWQLKGLAVIHLLWASRLCIPRAKVQWLYISDCPLRLRLVLISLRYIASHLTLRIYAAWTCWILVVGAVVTRLVMLNHIKV